MKNNDIQIAMNAAEIGRLDNQLAYHLNRAQRLIARSLRSMLKSPMIKTYCNGHLNSNPYHIIPK